MNIENAGKENSETVDVTGGEPVAAKGGLQIYRKEFGGCGIFLRKDTPDEVVARGNLGEEFALVIDLLSSAKGRKKLILDFGGYIGAAAIAFASRIENCVVVSVEPSPENFRMLQLNTARFDNIVPLNAAIGSVRTTAELFARHTGAWGHTLVSSPRDCKEIAPLGAVQVVTVEDLVGEYGRDCALALIKCDIEGGEVDLLSNPAWVEQWAIVTAELHERIKRGCKKAWTQAFEDNDSFMSIIASGEKRIAVNPRNLRRLHGRNA